MWNVKAFCATIHITIQDGGRTGRKILVKLACKKIFLPVLTSEESPMLLVRLCRTRRYPVLNSYNKIIKRGTVM